MEQRRQNFLFVCILVFGGTLLACSSRPVAEQPRESEATAVAGPGSGMGSSEDEVQAEESYQKIIEKYKNSNVTVHTFNQSRYPRIFKEIFLRAILDL